MLRTAWTKFRFPRTLRSENLPTLTLGIPARNETLSLVDCLNKVENLNYPKIETIVLDDQSSDDTSNAIRGFAHAGVRFISGEEPASGWIGKTYALAQIEKAASGEFIAFSNVDIRLSPNDLNYIMTVMKERKLDMISILPRPQHEFAIAALMEPLRFFWNVFLPLTRGRRPIGHRLWVIRRSTLANLGGIEGQNYKIAPENGLARRLISCDTYRFYISSSGINVRNTEDWRHELSSAVRNSFPIYKRRAGLAALGALVHLLLLSPYILIFLTCGAAWWGCLSAIIIESLAAIFYAALVRKSWFFAPLFWPFQLIQEVMVTIVSLLKYKYGTVDWRGRDIRLTVVRPDRHPDYRPAEEYIGDFHLANDKNKIKKHQHR
ncbi:MAG: glycosyltransferase [Candidatus Nomurabacteria bacterium]|jgi:glycosyltransferase involved in cell wall biosynthesis|nr:glycosyltransferase [Candidatus Nomurabacteria bacterium]